MEEPEVEFLMRMCGTSSTRSIESLFQNAVRVVAMEFTSQ